MDGIGFSPASLSIFLWQWVFGMESPV